MMRRMKKGSFPDPMKFEGPGVDFKAKLIGTSDISAARGDELCQDAISDLKLIALRNHKEKKEHKQKITINITLKGIRLIDETTERIDHAHPIQRISFISHDKNDKRTFSYIVGTKDGYKIFAIKTMKEAALITATLKDLFQEVFKRHQAKKEEDGVDGIAELEEKKSESEEEANGQIEEAEEAVEKSMDENDSQLILELNDQIKEMQSVGIIPHSNSFDMIDDPFIGVGAGVEETVETLERSDPFDDNFSPVTTPNSVDLFDDLKNDEKIDFVALPAPEDIVKNKTSSNLLPSAPVKNKSITTNLISVPPVKNKTTSTNLISVPPVKNKTSSADLLSVEPVQNKTSSTDLLSVEPVGQPVTSSKYSDDLFAVPDPPPRKGTTESEPHLMKHDPFDDLKKSIKELHKQNTMQQQQQQLSFIPAFPAQMSQQVPVQVNHPNPYIQNAPNPFLGSNNFANNTLPPALPARPSQPVVPPRPGVTNPFLSQSSNQTNVEPSMGWTVLNKSPAVVKKEVKQNAFASDPFSFLDDHPTLIANTQPVPATNSHFGGNKELLDLLG